MNRFDELIKNGTGYSSKSFALVVGAISVLLACLGFFTILFVDLLNPKLKIDSDMYALAAMVAAIQGLLTTMVGWFMHQKVKSESKEKPINKKRDEKDSNYNR